MRRALNIVIVIALTIHVAFPKATKAQDCDFKIVLQNNQTSFTKFGVSDKTTYAPQIRFGRLFCSGEFCSQIFDIQLAYDAQSKTVILTDGRHGNSIHLTINESHALVNGKKKQIDKNTRITLHINSGRTLFPLRFIFENLYPEGRIEWNDNTKTATLIIYDYECDNFSPDWAMQDGNPGKTRNIPEYSAPRTGNLSLHGYFQFNDSTMPIIFDGRMLYNKVGGNYNCIDIATKETIWNSDNLPPFGTPAYKDGIINFYGIEAFNASSGKLIWKSNSWDSYEILGDSAVYGENTYSINFKTNGKNQISCSEIETGKIVWEQNTGNDLITLSAIANIKLFLYIKNENTSAIRCIQANTGKFIWEKTSLRKLVCADKDVVVSEDSCMNAENGNQLWKLPFTSKEIALSEDNLLQCAEKISCYDKKTGRNIWTADIKVFSPIIAGDKVFATNGETLYCLNIKNGNILWNYDANFTHHSIIISGGYIALMGKNAICILKGKN